MSTRRFLEFAYKPSDASIPPNVSSKAKIEPHKRAASNAAKTPKPTRKKSSDPSSPKTQSFDAIWDGSLSSHHLFQHHDDGAQNPLIAATDAPPVEPHTLILGTHPSVTSLSVVQYYGHPMNAFWWIAGDCLGFRRAHGTKANGEPYKFASHLRHTDIISYEEQVKRLVKKGFAMWDLIGTCRRPGSLDQDITDETPNDIQSFCREHPSIRRIVFANGSTACKLFIKHHRSWLKCGQLVHSPDTTTKQAFGKSIPAYNEAEERNANEQWTSNHQIVLVSAISVSPAAARYTYLDKRNFWEENVYEPGLKLFRQSNSNSTIVV